MRQVLPPDAKLLPPEAKRVFKGIIYEVYQWDQAMFDGSREVFEMLKRPDTVKVIAVKDDKLVILEQEQPRLGHFFDIPGGRHDVESETELDAAKRELLEETGMSFKTWRLLEAAQPFTKIESFVYVFLATDFETQIEPTPDSGEKITTHLKTLAETIALADDPASRYLPKEILSKVSSVDELTKLPEFAGQTLE